MNATTSITNHTRQGLTWGVLYETGGGGEKDEDYTLQMCDS